MGDQQYGIDSKMLTYYTKQIKELIDIGVEVAVVIGGGNIFRGLSAAESGVERTQGDYMGMLATVINGMALQSMMETHGVYTRLISAIKMEQIAEPYIRRRAVRHLEKGRVVILRANEIKADIVLKATRVDGIYSADPEKDPTATKYDQISFNEVITKGLKIMDQAAFALCAENNLPIIVFDINEPTNLRRIIFGEQVGTLVTN
jgi:uridylate kinase